MSTLQASLLPTVRLRYTSSNSNSGTTFFSTISCLFILIHLISLPHQTCKKSYQTFHLLTYSYLSSCKHSPCLLLFHDPLLPTAPLHYKTYTSSNSNSGTTFFSHFPSKNLNKYTSSPKIPSKCLHDLAKIIPLHHHAPPFIQHFLLIMCEIVM